MSSMRIYYPIIFTGIEIILIMCANAARRSNKKIGKTVEYMLLSSTVIVFTQIMISAIPAYWVARIFFNIYYISIDVTLYLVMMYCYEYTHQQIRGTWWDYVVRVLIGADTLSIVGNIFGEYLTKTESFVVGDQTVYAMIFGKAYQGHLFLCYMLFMIALLAIFRKIVNTASVYWVSYIIIAASLLLIVVINLIYLVTDTTVDYSIIGYALGGFLIYYFSIRKPPMLLINNMLASIITEMNDGIVLFDTDRVCVYANNKARELLKVDSRDYVKCEEELLNWLQESNRYKTNDVFLEDTFVRMINGRKVSLKIVSRALRKGSHEIGICYQITNYSKEVELHKKERYMAFHDPLTGVYNRAGLFELIEQRLRENPDKRYYLMALDIRDFKGVNDVLGRKSGDELLVRVAKQLEEFDSLDAIYGRLVGDKFGIMLERDKFHAQRIPQMLNNLRFVESETSYMIVIHMGIYEIQENDPAPVDVMFDRAIFAISKIKNSFEERMVFYDETARKDMLWEQSISGELGKALEHHQFKPFLQPQVDRDGVSHGAEVLVRWEHPTEGLLLPNRFINIFEKNGMILKLDKYMWESACQLLKEWKDKGFENYYLSVNISPRDIYLMDVGRYLKDLVLKYDVSPKNLKLEITETMISDAKRCIDLIQQLQEYGFVVEMDDFGSGYSSLNTLKNIPVDVLKMDMGFLRESADTKKGEEILSFVVELSKKLNIGCIAEGIETKEQLDFLMKCGCDVFQGYYFSRPIPVYEYEEKYMKKQG